MRICQAMNGFIYSNLRHLPYGKGEKQRTTKPIHINISQKVEVKDGISNS
jgi:hypothetical protein